MGECGQCSRLHTDNDDCKAMVKKHCSPVDRISDLPDFILHYILSFLPMKAVAWTSVLSKRWHHVWESYPITDFCQLDFGVPFRFPVHLHYPSSLEQYAKYCQALERFTNFVDQKLQKYCKHNSGIQKFGLHISPCEPKFYSLVDKWIELATEKHVKNLRISFLFQRDEDHYRLTQKIFAAKSLTRLYFRSNETVLQSAIKHNTLVTLWLTGVCFDEMLMLDDQKLPCIKSISLSECIVPEGVKISCRRLEKLKLMYCKLLDKIEIFAPNLTSMSYSCKWISIPSIFSLSSPSRLPRLKLHLMSFHDLQTSSFVRVKEFVLRTKNQTESLSIRMSDKKVEFDRDEASRSCLSPPYALKCLELAGFLSEKIDFAALMDGLFWSFHPEILSMPFIQLEEEKCFLEFLCKTLNGRQDDGCCSSCEMKCWRHSFTVKDVIVKDTEGYRQNVPFCWDALLKAIEISKGGTSADLHLTW